MKIVFHEKYYNSDYAWDPAASAGRLEGIMDLISKNKEYEIITPSPATEEDILRAHTSRHLQNIKNNVLLFELASLAAGGAILDDVFSAGPANSVRPEGHNVGDELHGHTFPCRGWHDVHVSPFH